MIDQAVERMLSVIYLDRAINYSFDLRQAPSGGLHLRDQILLPRTQVLAGCAGIVDNPFGAVDRQEDSAATFERARSFFTSEQIVELCLVAGYYIMTAGLLLTFDIEIEDTPPLGASMTARAAPDA